MAERTLVVRADDQAALDALGGREPSNIRRLSIQGLESPPHEHDDMVERVYKLEKAVVALLHLLARHGIEPEGGD